MASVCTEGSAAAVRSLDRDVEAIRDRFNCVAGAATAVRAWQQAYGMVSRSSVRLKVSDPGLPAVLKHQQPGRRIGYFAAPVTTFTPHWTRFNDLQQVSLEAHDAITIIEIDHGNVQRMARSHDKDVIMASGDTQ